MSSNKRARTAPVLIVLGLLAGCHSPGRSPNTTSTSDLSTTQLAPSTTAPASTTAAPPTTALPVAVGRAQDRDLSVTVRATPSRVGRGTPVRFDIEVTGLRVDNDYAIAVQFGDGTGDERGAAGCAAPTVGQTTSTELPAPPAKTKSDSRSHAYSTAGSYSATVDVFSGYPCASTSWARKAIATVEVSVA